MVGGRGQTGDQTEGDWGLPDCIRRVPQSPVLPSAGTRIGRHRGRVAPFLADAPPGSVDHISAAAHRVRGTGVDLGSCAVTLPPGPLSFAPPTNDIRQLAVEDALTGAANRRRFDEAIRDQGHRPATAQKCHCPS